MLRHRLAMLVVFVVVLVGDGAYVRHHPEGLHPRPGQRLAVRSTRGGAGHLVLRDDRAPAPARGRDRHARIRTSTAFMVRTAAAAVGIGNTGRSFRCTLKPRAERPQSAQQIVAAAAAASSPSVPGIPRLRASAAGDPHRRQRIGNSAYNVHAAERRHRRALPLGAAARARRCARVPELQDVTRAIWRSRARRSIIDIDRDKAAALGLNATQIAGRAVQRPSAAKWSSTIYAPTNQYRVLLELDPQVSAATPTRSTQLYVRVAATARWCRWSGGRPRKETVGPQSINHSGPAPVGDDLVRLAARRLARHGGRRSVEAA